MHDWVRSYCKSLMIASIHHWSDQYPDKNIADMSVCLFVDLLNPSKDQTVFCVPFLNSIPIVFLLLSFFQHASIAIKLNCGRTGAHGFLQAFGLYIRRKPNNFLSITHLTFHSIGMAKIGMGKLKCMIKKWHGSGSRTSGRIKDEKQQDQFSDDTIKEEEGLHPVYVGKSRRRYLIKTQVLEHPLFQILMQRSTMDSDMAVVGCEVVLFDHMLWMLQNEHTSPDESLLNDELVDFYSC